MNKIGNIAAYIAATAIVLGAIDAAISTAMGLLSSATGYQFETWEGWLLVILCSFLVNYKNPSEQ